MKPGVLSLPTGYSWQNPAWSPDMKSLSLTRFNRYNEGDNRIATYDLATSKVNILAHGVSQPGACWHPSSGIIFSNDCDRDYYGDQIFVWRDGHVRNLFSLRGHSCYEPSWSKDGLQFAVEVHPLDDEGSGQIAVVSVAIAGSRAFITPAGHDCRQPNWDWHSDAIVYQRQIRKDVWWLFTNGGKQLCEGTDATFTPTGDVIFSGEGGLFLYRFVESTVVPIGPRGAYKGAPSVSPNGKWIACEASDRDPDDGPGTRIEIWQFVA